MPNRVLYAELTPQEFRERIAKAPIAYLPLGTLEWHGEHLPLGADGLQSQGFFEQLAREAGGIVLPMLFLGVDRMLKGEKRDLYGMDICTDRPQGRSSSSDVLVFASWSVMGMAPQQTSSATMLRNGRKHMIWTHLLVGEVLSTSKA